VQVLQSRCRCPISEIAGLGQGLRPWRAEVLAHFDTGGISDGGAEAIVEKTCRFTCGFRNFGNYRIYILLADGTRP
jgi:transposase